MADYSNLAIGYLDAQLDSSKTSGTFTFTAIDVNGSPVTWPTGEHRIQLVYESRTELKYEVIKLSSASQSAAVVTATIDTRDLSDTDHTTEATQSSPITFPSGTKVIAGWDQHAAGNTALINAAQTFLEDQTIENSNKVLFGGAAAYVWTEDSGTNLKFKDGSNSETTLSTLAASGNDEKVGVDSGATAGYIGAAAGDGVLRTDATLSYTDGGDFVTLGLNHLGLEDLSDPGADRIVFWDDSETASKFLTVGSGLSLSGTTLSSASMGVVAQSTSLTTLARSATTEGDLISFTETGGVPSDNTRYTFYADGVMRSQANNVTIRLYIDGQVVASGVATAGMTETLFSLHGEIHVRTSGASGVAVGGFKIITDDGKQNIFGSSVDIANPPTETTVSIDTTTNFDVKITAQAAGSSTNNYFASNDAVIYRS